MCGCTVGAILVGATVGGIDDTLLCMLPRRLMGSTSEPSTEGGGSASGVPVLETCTSDALTSWGSGRRKLRIMIPAGVFPSSPSRPSSLWPLPGSPVVSPSHTSSSTFSKSARCTSPRFACVGNAPEASGPPPSWKRLSTYEPRRPSVCPPSSPISRLVPSMDLRVALKWSMRASKRSANLRRRCIAKSTTRMPTNETTPMVVPAMKPGESRQWFLSSGSTNDGATGSGSTGPDETSSTSMLSRLLNCPEFRRFVSISVLAFCDCTLTSAFSASVCELKPTTR
mmetsp:Transcript_48202/g.114196  ORF Transcript_48202/g.114196 Transcript_48202/m.114196 type:complete len:283 (-) Transcript_48202:1110-1958(-)